MLKFLVNSKSRAFLRLYVCIFEITKLIQSEYGSLHAVVRVLPYLRKAASGIFFFIFSLLEALTQVSQTCK